MWTHIRRITNYYVKTTILHDLGKLLLPVEGLLFLPGVAKVRTQVFFCAGDQGIALADVVHQVGQESTLIQGFEQKVKLGDFHRLSIQIHSIEVLIEELNSGQIVEKVSLLGVLSGFWLRSPLLPLPVPF